jgi:xylulokinase
MNRKLLLAIDIGTTNSKGALFTLDGNAVAFASRRHAVRNPREGWAEHDAEQVWWKDLREICGELTGAENISASDIVSVGISSLNPALVPVDGQGKALCPAMLYGLDRRAVQETADLAEELGAYLEERGEGRISPLSIGPKILWLKRHEPEVFRQAAYFVGVPTFLVWRLTGSIVTDIACNTISGVPFSRNRLVWDETMCRACGIAADRLPALRFATERAGAVTKGASACTGLLEGTPVAVGTGDFPAEYLSYGTNFSKTKKISLGTTVGVNFGNDPSPGLFNTYSAATRRINAPGGAMSSGCSSIDWVLSMISGVGADARIGDATLCEMAGASPAGANGITVLPYLNGEKNPFLDPGAKGMIFGLRTGTTRADLYKASLEGLAYAIRHMIAVHSPGDSAKEAIVIGGGTRMPMLVQTVSDVTGYSLIKLKDHYGSLAGGAFIAGMAGGVFSKQDDINSWVKIDETVEPRSELEEIYSRGFQTYRDLYGATADIMHR